MCDNCTTIVRVRAIEFEFVRVRVRENFFVREHLYADTTCLTQAGYVGEDVESILFKVSMFRRIYDIH